MPSARPDPRRRATVRKKPSLDFSVTGLIYTSMMLFMGLAAINSQANLLFAVFGLMIGVLIVSGIVSRLVLRRIEIHRSLPDFLVVGEATVLQYEFENTKRFWPSLSVTLGELSNIESFTKQPQAYLLHAAAGTRAMVPMSVVPTRRGLHHFDRFQLSTSFPFGFIKRAVDRRLSDTILIEPAVAQVDPKLLLMCLSAERSGSRMKPRRGGTDEFYGVKEFREGENPRWIHWRRSARTGTLVSKEMTQVAPPRLLILLDTFIPAEERIAAKLALVERAIAMAASLVKQTLDEGLAVGLYVWSNDWVHIQPSRGKRHARDLLSVLSRLPLNAANERKELLSTGLRFLRTGMTAVVISPHESEEPLPEQGRGRIITIISGSDQAKRWFHFDPAIDFEQCMPADQQAAIVHSKH
jgi:uncharacterized protein (DUF58 family)